MKKKIIILPILSIVLLSSCSKLSTNISIHDNTVSSKEPQISSTLNTTTVLEDNSYSLNATPSPTPSDNLILSAMQAFKSVLLNEEIFTCTDKEPYNTIDNVHQYTGYLKDVPFNESIMETPQFAVVDLDGDDISEILLAINNYHGFVILRYK